jgi:hypothetical protein
MNLIFENLDGNKNFINCNDINPSGIGRFGNSALINATHLYCTSNQKPLIINYCGLNDNVKNYVISAGVNHSPEDWTGYNPRVKSLFSYLNEKYLRDLQNGNALLLLDQSLEGYQTPWLFNWFHEECNNYKISPKQIVYVTGNMIVDEVYEKWANDNNINERMLVIGYPHFELDMGMSCNNLSRTEKSLPTFNDHIQYKLFNSETLKTYACLNKRIRPHRVWFYRYLYYSGLLNKGLVSMNEFQKHPYNWEGKHITDKEIEEISKILPLRVYGKPNNELDDSFYINRFNDQICLDTFLTVISEAHSADTDQTMFISEKTFKVIACRHPFIIMGNKNSMDKMKSLGYKTFDGFIDESYDNLPTHERMERIIESIKKIDKLKNKIKWFRSLEEVIEHNYNTLISKLKRKPDSYVILENYYNNMFSKDLI